LKNGLLEFIPVIQDHIDLVELGEAAVAELLLNVDHPLKQALALSLQVVDFARVA